MHTSLHVDNANCSFCVNSTRIALLASPLVQDVSINMQTGCWHIDHHLPDANALRVVLRDSLHIWVVAENGETEMVQIGVGENDECPLHRVTKSLKHTLESEGRSA